ncbi:hypothetical protein [Pelosinus baikalensis]|uniref:Uncharacterized protein n=1 Tax=Pelosinus baikalensis TaxID=2892015 RepID=A0ABS8HUQ6_9FIRM|nr:hypothetical protein [Pelosinus baikalensis]MCC5466259.1 hypothetical protein [Pelosinus baikalensis]
MEKILQQLLEGQNKLFENQDKKSKKLDLIEQAVLINNDRLNNIDSKLAKNTSFISALSQDVARTATKNSINRLDTKIDLINNKLFQTEQISHY